ncbi:hypothetical protein K431DRAFT_216830 [Polychaeton citri CBS 116435]|uniref:ATP-dependent protease n=1 Tax=Polychaeton citri CBS 116435 TaxID=1314669 RepID=A0A9P4QF15_9PEZI|nr:hypothetical protein K431DRAFT_216830 [Polychaeton citri CBS 116435]
MQKPLAAHGDARALVRLIQCRICSKPLSQPVTLPCGYALCRGCLPEAHERANISYPGLPSRKIAIQCPFEDCKLPHPLSDCSVDVTMSKVMDSVADVVARHASLAESENTVLMTTVGLQDAESFGIESEKPHSRTLTGGRLIATYTLAAEGNLRYDLDVNYEDSESQKELQSALDAHVLEELIESTSNQVECHVCYQIMLEPVTTYCGHSLCRKCMTRSLDHSLHCPSCRRPLTVPPSLVDYPNNKALVDLLNGLCPDTITARAEALTLEELGGEGDLKTPLFVCTLGFPQMPTFLRIFEPRYRLMLRRCLEGNGEFGMMMYNRYGEPQGDLGVVHFYRYGIMLRIVQSQLMADGTSLIETRGSYRFRIKAHGTLDGYTIGSVERVEDIPLTEEERIEAEETSLPSLPENADMSEHLKRMPTQRLLSIGHEFITKMRGRSAAWLQQRVLDVHGEPPEDAALFPYWFASVLPISEDEKYKLLPTTTVRERLKITATWIKRIESQRW